MIFLDEPTTGLDPRSRRAMWQIVRELVAGGVTIFLTTQYLEEADELADRIAVLDRGRIVAEGTADELKRRIPGGHIRLRFADRRTSTSAARAVRPGDRATATRSPCGCRTTAASAALQALLDRLDRAAVEVDALSVHTPDLDDVFLALTGRPHAREGGHRDEHCARYARDRLGDDAAPQPQAHACATRP